MTPKLSRSSKDPVLSVVSIITALEAQYRTYRKAADRFHQEMEKGFEAMRNVLSKSESAPHSGNPHSNAPHKANTVSPRSEPKPLSKRETQILQLIAEGHGTKQAAEYLGIAFKTAVGHRSNLMSKLGIHDVARLTRYAIRAGLIEP